MIRCYNFEVYTESLDGIIRYRKSEPPAQSMQSGW